MDTDDPPPPARCPYCEQMAPSHRSQGIYWLWECDCGGLGVGEQPCDLDEVADSLMDFLQLPPAPTQARAMPPEPVGESGLIYAQYYDNNTLAGRLRPFFREQGYELLLVKSTMGERPGFEAEMARELRGLPDQQSREMLDRVRRWDYWFLWARRLSAIS